MSAKELLFSIKEIQKDIEIKTQLIATHRDIATGLQSPQYSDMPKNPNRKLQPMADSINKAMDLEEEVKELERELIQVKTRVYEIIQNIDSKVHQLILLERYINGKSWSSISRMIGYANSRMYDKHNHALMDFSTAYEKFGVNRSTSE